MIYKTSINGTARDEAQIYNFDFVPGIIEVNVQVMSMDKILNCKILVA